MQKSVSLQIIRYKVDWSLIVYIAMLLQNALSGASSDTRARHNMRTFRAINFVNPLSVSVNASI